MQRRDNELDHMRSIVSSKEQEITNLKELGKIVQLSCDSGSHQNMHWFTVAELQKLQDKLTHSEQELQSARYVC